MEELIQLDKQLLLWFNGSDSLFLDGLVNTLTTATTWIPLYLGLFYMVLKNNDNVQKVLLILGCAGLCVLLAGSLNDLFIKPSLARWRPSRDQDIAMLVDVVNGYRGGRYGFFSSHAANTFSIAIFFTLLGAVGSDDTMVATELLDTSVSGCPFSWRHPLRSALGRCCWYGYLVPASVRLSKD